MRPMYLQGLLLCVVSSYHGLNAFSVPSRVRGYGIREHLNVKLPKTLTALRAEPKDEKDLNISDIMREAEEALSTAEGALSKERQDAQKALFEAKAQSKAELKAVASRQLTPEERTDAALSAFGGALTGALLAGGALLQSQDLLDLAGPIVPPIVASLAFGAGAYGVGSLDNTAGEITRNVLGGSLRAVGRSIKDAITNAIVGAVDAAQVKAEQAKNDIIEFPGKVVEATARKAEETAENIKIAVETKATEVVADIKAAPKYVVEQTKRAVEDAVDDTIDRVERAVDDVVEGVVSLPQRTLAAVEQTVEDAVAAVEQSVEDVVASVTGSPSKISDAPEPPKTPPPVPDLESPRSAVQPNSLLFPPLELPKISLPKIEPPKFSFPNFNPPKPKPAPPRTPPMEGKKRPPPKLTIPKIEPPKPSLPKFESPQFNIGSEVALQKFKEAEKRKGAEANKGAAEAAKRKQIEEQKAAAEAKRRQAEEKQASMAATEAKRKEAEEKKAAEAKRKEAEEKKAAMAAEARRKEEEQRQSAMAAGKAKRIEAEQKQAAIAAAAEAKRQQAQEAVEARAAAEEGKKAAAAAKRKQAEAEKLVRTSSPGATISLGSLFGFGGNDDEPAAGPAGVPVISDWEQNSDGSITGKITGKLGFGFGEAVTTSPVPKGAVGGKVVTTSSGSKYFLAPLKGKDQKAVAAAKQAAAAEQKRKEAEERKSAQLKVEEEKRAAAAAAAAEQRRQVAAEARRKEAEEKQAAAAQAAEAKRKQAEERAATSAAESRAREAEKLVSRSVPGATINLGALFGFGGNDSSESVTTGGPSGVPVISDWKQNADGSITGKISGKSGFRLGEAVTTSPVPKGAVGGRVVTTSSGSKYFLAPQTTKAQGQDQAAAKKAAADEAKRKEAEEKKAAQLKVAEEKRLAVEKQRLAAERIAAAAAAAEEQRRLIEEKKATAAEKERRRLAEENSAEAAGKELRRLAEERERLAQERKTAAEAAAEAKRREAEEKKLAAVEARKAQDEAKREAAKRIAQQAAEKRNAAAATASLRAVSATPTSMAPPKGVPVIKSWKERRDGGITGRIYGSPNFADGDFVETSPIIKGSYSNGSVVQTSSGSKYFLSPDPAVKQANILSAINNLASAKPGSTITLTQERKEREAKAAMEAVDKAKPRSTFSLFDMGYGAVDKGLPAKEPPQSASKAKPTPAKPPAKTAPRGVPTFTRWRKNGDGSITGIIGGSNVFSDGDRVTTSPISRGEIEKGEVVTTGSGSRYFLA